VPAKLSETYYRFSPTGEKVPARWMPLVFALRWAAENPAGDDRPLPGDTLLRKFLSQAASSRG
jgi:hypothetical protein